jgi:hypothetical protein
LPFKVLGRFNIEVSKRLLFWWCSIVTVLLYASGILLSDLQAHNYFFTFGGFVAVLTWHSIFESFKPTIELYWKDLGNKVYRRSSTKYFYGFIVFLILAIVMMMLRLELIAEQLALIGYFLLIVGVFLELIDLKKDTPLN